MRIKLLGFCLISLWVFTSQWVHAQETQLFTDYKDALANGNVPVLPNFSFAGYHHAERGLPSDNELPTDYFDVTAYGADKTGNQSSNQAIRNAIAAAETNGSGVVYFPEGTYVVLDENDDQSKPIYIRKSNIVLKGDGPDKTMLDQKVYTTHPDMVTKDWTCPHLFQFKPSNGGATILTTIEEDAQRESYTLKVNSVAGISQGQWVRISLLSTDAGAIANELSPYSVTDLRYDNGTKAKIETNGIKVHEIHQVANVDAVTNTITFVEPIQKKIIKADGWTLDSYRFIEEVGMQDLKYKGGFTWEHHHHKNPNNDPNFTDNNNYANYKFMGSSGWSAIKFDFVINGWVTNVEFTQTSQCALFVRSAHCSAIKNTYTGNPVHNFITAHSSTKCLLGLNQDKSANGIWHGCGVNKESIGTVLWRNNHPKSGKSGMESHADQPRVTLIDKSTGGLFFNMGGSKGALPNHLGHMVVWNFDGVSYQTDNVKTWRTDTDYSKFLPPIIVGLKGFTIDQNTTPSQYQEYISPGVHVAEESLYEAQLRHRKNGALPEWVDEARSTVKMETFEKLEGTNPASWVTNDPFDGDHAGWTLSAKRVEGGHGVDGSKAIYFQKNKTGIVSDSIAGGIGTFKMRCKNLWSDGKERKIELHINDEVITRTNPGAQNEVYTLDFGAIKVPNHVLIKIKNASAENEDCTISIDDLEWTPFFGPSRPGTLTVSSVTMSSVDLSWETSEDDVAVTGYKVYVDGSEIAEASAGATSYQVTGLTQGTPYAFTVKAVDAEGNESTPIDNQATTVSQLTKVETFEKLTETDPGKWVTNAPFAGDNGIDWKLHAKKVEGYINTSESDKKGIYFQKGQTGIKSDGAIAGGIAKLEFKAKNKWSPGCERKIELRINDNSIAVKSGGSTLNDEYTLKFENLQINQVDNIEIINVSDDTQNCTVAIDDLKWTTYSGPANARTRVKQEPQVKEELSLNMAMYPNPIRSFNQLHIRFTGFSQFSTGAVKLLDLTGKSVLAQKTYTVSNNEIRLPVKLVPGSYIVVVKAGGAVLNKKLIVK